jgi:hypothetical protein
MKKMSLRNEGSIKGTTLSRASAGKVCYADARRAAANRKQDGMGFDVG